MCLTHGKHSTGRDKLIEPSSTTSKSSQFINYPNDNFYSNLTMNIKELNYSFKVQVPKTPNISSEDYPRSSVCLTENFVADGHWHWVTGGIYANNLVLKVEENEILQKNYSQIPENHLAIRKNMTVVLRGDMKEINSSSCKYKILNTKHEYY